MQKVTADGLWQCLCPVLSKTFPSVRGSVGRPQWLPQRNDHLPYKRAASAATFRTLPRRISQQCSEKYPSSWKWTPSVCKQQRRYLNDTSFRHPRRISRQAEIDALYEELQTSNKKAKYDWAHSTIRKLVEDHHQQPSIQLYVGLILTNTDPRNGSVANVEEVLEEMGREGIVPDSAIYHAILKVLSIHPSYLLRAEILEAMRQRWFTLSDEGWHDYMAGLIRDRQLESALDTLYMLHDAGKRIESWLHDIFVYTLCDLEEFDEVLYIMRYREDIAQERNISPALWAHILDTASQCLNYEVVAWAWRKRVEAEFLNPSLGVCLNVLNTAARHGDSRIALDVFRVFRERKYPPEIYHYEALIEAYVSGPNTDFCAAAMVLFNMASAGVIPTPGSTRPLYLFLKKYQKSIAELLQLLEELKQKDQIIPLPLLNLLLEAYISQDDLLTALNFYKTRFKSFVPSGPNLQTIHILLESCHLARRKDVAVFLTEEILRLKLRPTSDTYDHLILAHLYGNPEPGEEPEQGWDDAWRYYLEMKGLGLIPSLATYEALAMKGCEMGDDKVWQLISEQSSTGEANAEVELRVRKVIGRHQDRGGKLRMRTPLEKIDAEKARSKAEAGRMMDLGRKAMNLFV